MRVSRVRRVNFYFIKFCMNDFNVVIDINYNIVSNRVRLCDIVGVYF